MTVFRRPMNVDTEERVFNPTSGFNSPTLASQTIGFHAYSYLVGLPEVLDFRVLDGFVFFSCKTYNHCLDYKIVKNGK